MTCNNNTNNQGKGRNFMDEFRSDACSGVEVFHYPRHFRTRVVFLAIVSGVLGLLALWAAATTGTAAGPRLIATGACVLMLAATWHWLRRAAMARSRLILDEIGITRTHGRDIRSIAWRDIREIRNGRGSVMLHILAGDAGMIIVVEKDIENINGLLDRILDYAPLASTSGLRKRTFGFPRRDVLGFIAGLALVVSSFWIVPNIKYGEPLVIPMVLLALALLPGWRRLRALVINAEGIVVRTPVRAIGIPFADVLDTGMTDRRWRLFRGLQRMGAYIVRENERRLILAENARALPVYASVRHAWLAAGGRLPGEFEIPDYSATLPGEASPE